MAVGELVLGEGWISDDSSFYGMFNLALLDVHLLLNLMSLIFVC